MIDYINMNPNFNQNISSDIPMNMNINSNMPMNPMNMNPMMNNMTNNVNQQQIDPMAGVNLYKPVNAGTNISDICNDNNSIASNKQRSQYPNYQGNQNMNYAMNNMIDPRYNSIPIKRNNKSRYNELTRLSEAEHSQHDSRMTDSDSIRELADDVNSSLQALEQLEKRRRKSQRSRKRRNGK